MTEQPQLYLISPEEADLDIFPAALARVLDAHEIACLRLAFATREADRLTRLIDACREVATSRDVAVVVADHVGLVEKLGLDGVHLTDGRAIRDARKTLGPDAIVGAFCGASRHDGMSAGEAGADYVAFGPLGDEGLGETVRADADLFAWWSEMIEVPVVAEGALHADLIAALAPVTDFFGISEIWRADDPAAALSELIASLR